MAGRGHHDVVLENVALRRQLRTLQGRVKRPHLRTRDRCFVLLATAWPQWRSSSNPTPSSDGIPLAASALGSALRTHGIPPPRAFSKSKSPWMMIENPVGTPVYPFGIQNKLALNVFVVNGFWALVNKLKSVNHEAPHESTRGIETLRYERERRNTIPHPPCPASRRSSADGSSASRRSESLSGAERQPSFRAASGGRRLRGNTSKVRTPAAVRHGGEAARRHPRCRQTPCRRRRSAD